MDLSLYYFMVGAAVLNVVGFFTFPAARRNKRYVIFCLVCSFRAVLPRLDAERVCFFDLGIISSPFVGRVCATAAEISFGFLMGDLLWELTPRRSPSSFRPRATILVQWLTVIAQCFCWYGVATKDQYWNMFEESMWAIASGLATIYTIVRLPWDRDVRVMLFLTGMAVYCAYLVLVDVPMYYRRWSVDYRDVTPLPFVDGVIDMMQCLKVEQDSWKWKEDFTWMGPYFSAGVAAALWAALYVTH